jgi:hypothetical protein
MLKPYSKIFQAALLIAFVVVLSLSAVAQNPSSSTAKKSGASASCDGALDIVPSKPMTFARKRRPAKTDGKQQVTPADSKSAQKQPDKKGI